MVVELNLVGRRAVDPSSKLVSRPRCLPLSCCRSLGVVVVCAWKLCMEVVVCAFGRLGSARLCIPLDPVGSLRAAEVGEAAATHPPLCAEVIYDGHFREATHAAPFIPASYIFTNTTLTAAG
eukprot:SAG22_NODE_9371_length_592_cov_16.028398_2_plen_121_part_01